MQLNKNFTTVFIIALVFLFEITQANGWTQKKGNGYIQFSSRVTVADEFYEPGGNKVDITTFGDYSFSIFANYGLTDKLTVFGSFPFKRLTLNRIEGKNSGFEFFPGDSKNGISDFTVGVKYGLGKIGSTSFAASLALGIPVGDNEQPNGLYTGDGEFNQHISIGFGHSFKGPIYIAGKAGYNFRSNDYSDEVRYNFEIGYRVNKSILLMLKADGVETTRNGADGTLGGTAGLFANNQNYLAYGPEIIYSFSDLMGLNLGVYSGTRTENVVSALSYKAGIFYKIR